MLSSLLDQPAARRALVEALVRRSRAAGQPLRWSRKLPNSLPEARSNGLLRVLQRIDREQESSRTAHRPLAVDFARAQERAETKSPWSAGLLAPAPKETPQDPAIDSVNVTNYGALGREIHARGRIKAGDTLLFLDPNDAASKASLWIGAPLRPHAGGPGIGIAGADNLDIDTVVDTVNGPKIVKVTTKVPLLTRVVRVDLALNALELRDAAVNAVAEWGAVHADDRPPIQEALDYVPRFGVHRDVRIPPGTYPIGVPGAVRITQPIPNKKVPAPFLPDPKPGNLPLFIDSYTSLRGTDRLRRPVLKLADDVGQTAPLRGFPGVAAQLSRCVFKHASILLNRRCSIWWAYVNDPPWKGPSGTYPEADHDIEIAHLVLDGNKVGQPGFTTATDEGLWAGGNRYGLGALPQPAGQRQPLPRLDVEVDHWTLFVVYKANNTPFDPEQDTTTSASNPAGASTNGTQIIHVELPEPPPKMPTPLLFFKRIQPVMEGTDCPPQHFFIQLAPGTKTFDITGVELAKAKLVMAPDQFSFFSANSISAGIYLANAFSCQVRNVIARECLTEGISIADGATPNPANLDLPDVAVEDIFLEDVLMAHNGRQGLAISGRARNLLFRRCVMEWNRSGGCDIEPTGASYSTVNDGIHFPFLVPIPQRLSNIVFDDCDFRHHLRETAAGLIVQPNWAVVIDGLTLIGCRFDDNFSHFFVGQKNACAPNERIVNGVCVPAVPDFFFRQFAAPAAVVTAVMTDFKNAQSFAVNLASGQASFLTCNFIDNVQSPKAWAAHAADIMLAANTREGPSIWLDNDCVVKRFAGRGPYPTAKAAQDSDFGSIAFHTGAETSFINSTTFDGGHVLKPSYSVVFVRVDKGAIAPNVAAITKVYPSDVLRAP